jgi:transposase/predicted phosphodiesterase
MDVPEELTRRQTEVVRCLPDGKDQIAAELGITESTVENHVNNVRTALNNRDAIVWDKQTEQYSIASERLRALIHGSESEDIQEPSTTSTAGGTSDTSDGEERIEIPDGIVDRLGQAGMTYEDIENEYGIKNDTARRLLQRLREQGYRVDFKETGSRGKRLFYIPTEQDKRFKAGDGDGTYEIAIISDTHLGSKAEHLEELNDFYDRAQARGVDFVLHAGDIGDGWKVHRGHINEIKGEAAGWDRLTQYIVDNYPKREGLDTLFISGNHDHKLHRRTGLYFGERIDNKREDLHWLGDSQARVVLDPENDIDIELIHPSGGQPYTVGYRLQTLYRERGLDNRPTIAAVGHLHGSIYAETEGVFGLYAGAWKGTTTWGKRKGFQTTIGGWLVEIEVVDGEVRRFAPEWVNYGEQDSTNNFGLEDITDMIS